MINKLRVINKYKTITYTITINNIYFKPSGFVRFISNIPISTYSKLYSCSKLVIEIKIVIPLAKLLIVIVYYLTKSFYL